MKEFFLATHVRVKPTNAMIRNLGKIVKSTYVKLDKGNVQMLSEYNDYPMYEEKEEEQSPPSSPKSSPSSSPRSSP